MHFLSQLLQAKAEAALAPGPQQLPQRAMVSSKHHTEHQKRSQALCAAGGSPHVVHAAAHAHAALAHAVVPHALAELPARKAAHAPRLALGAPPLLGGFLILWQPHTGLPMAPCNQRGRLARMKPDSLCGSHTRLRPESMCRVCHVSANGCLASITATTVGTLACAVQPRVDGMTRCMSQGHVQEACWRGAPGGMLACTRPRIAAALQHAQSGQSAGRR